MGGRGKGRERKGRKNGNQIRVIEGLKERVPGKKGGGS